MTRDKYERLDKRQLNLLLHTLEILYKSREVDDPRPARRIIELVNRPKLIVMLPVGVEEKRNFKPKTP